MCEEKLSVFSGAYWRTARNELKNPRVLAFAGLVCAISIVLESLPIYLLGPSLKIYFSFLAVSLGCMCYGPCVGMMAGAIIDSVGFLLSSYGEPYFPGYLISAVLSGLIYGVMLYRQQPTLPRVIITRLIINYGSNVLLGSVWKAMLYGKGYLYYFTSGLVKNTTMLPIEVPRAMSMMRSCGTPCHLNAKTSIGTMTMPPPTPSSPARTPATAPRTQ